MFIPRAIIRAWDAMNMKNLNDNFSYMWLKLFGNIEGGDMQDQTVGTKQIANLAVTNAKIISLDCNKLNVGTLTGFTIQTAITGARLILNANDFTSYNASNINTLKINGNNISFYDNANGLLCGHIMGTSGYVSVGANTGVTINVNSQSGLGVYELNTMVYNELSVKRISGLYNQSQLPIGMTGSYIETIVGRTIIHHDALNYIDIGIGTIRTYRNGVSGEIATTDQLPDLTNYATLAWVALNFVHK